MVEKMRQVIFMLNTRQTSISGKRRSRRKERRRLVLLALMTVTFLIGALLGYLSARTAASIAAKAEYPREVPYPEISSCGRSLDGELKSAMLDACERYNVPFSLAVAVAEQESRFDPKARSKTGDYGMMQINKSNFSWLREMGIEPLDEKGNITAGVYMLSEALSRCNTVNEALMVYNRGAAGAKRLWKKGIYSTRYSRETMERYDKWDRILNTEKWEN